MSPSEIAEEVRRVWLGKFREAYSYLAWAEVTIWNLEAAIEFTDGTRSTLPTDGYHVALQDHAGKFWFICLRRPEN